MQSSKATKSQCDGIDRFRRLALSLPGAVEASHMGRPDFRVNNHIFATLAYGARGLGTLKLTQEQQIAYTAERPDLFQPAPGRWGRMGMTLLRLDLPEDEVVASALQTAYHNVLSKPLSSVGKKRARLVRER